jgi:transposase-like protein
LQASLRVLGLYVRRSNRLSLHTAGLRVHESQEGLLVIRTHRCELHPDSLSTFRPPHDSFRAYWGQLGRSVCGKLGITEQTYYRWRKEYRNLRVEQVRRLKDLRSPLTQRAFAAKRSVNRPARRRGAGLTIISTSLPSLVRQRSSRRSEIPRN